jgi:monothiol glutaredoxin
MAIPLDEVLKTMSLDPALRSRIESILKANRVVLFMKGQPSMPQCGFSAKSVGTLTDLGVEFAHVNVLADNEIREGIKTYGDWPTIPQLYVDGELVGGNDIIQQLAASGELSELLGLSAPDRTPPAITVTPAAVEMLKGALAENEGASLQLSIDANYQPDFQLAPFDAGAIAAESNGLRVQFDLASARRAEGITIDWVDDIRGRGLAINNPNAPRPVEQIEPREAADRVAAGKTLLVDVRPADERAISSVNVAFETFDEDNRARLEGLPKDTAIAFLCRSGGRSHQAAEHFRTLGFSAVANIAGGINAWAEQVDDSVTRY